MLKDNLERTLQEFIPHSASYCIPDLVKTILEQVLMKHHDDISKQDDDAIAEATEAILKLVKKEKGERK